MSKRKRRSPLEHEETPMDDSPFRPTGGIRKKMDNEATTPGLPATMLDELSDSPDVDGTPTRAPEEMADPANIPTSPRTRSENHPETEKATEVRKAPTARPSKAGKPSQPAKPAESNEPEPIAKPFQPTDLPASSPARSTQRLERKRKKPADPVQPAAAAQPVAEASPHLHELSNKLDQQINATLDAIDLLRQNVEEADTHRQELLSEAQTVNRNYKQLVEKIIAERDALSKELSQVRSQYAADAKKQAQAFNDLQRDLEKERRENERKLREAEEEVQRQNQRIAELESQLEEAMASRDRIADRVRQVEVSLEQSILPLREELDQARAREAKTLIELDGANKEIAALKLLAAGPPTRD